MRPALSGAGETKEVNDAIEALSTEAVMEGNFLFESAVTH
jgi:hypothetical protein